MMPSRTKIGLRSPIGKRLPATGSQSIDWYSQGDERIVEADGLQVVVDSWQRKGRRGRIALRPARSGVPCSRPKEDRSVARSSHLMVT